MRMEELPLIGLPNFLLFLNNEELKIFIPPRGEVYVGQATAENLARVLPISFPLEYMASVLMGIPPCKSTSTPPVYPAENNFYRINMDCVGAKGNAFFINEKSGQVTKMKLSVSGKEYAAEFTDFVPVGAFSFPSKVTLFSEADNVRVAIIYKDIEILEEAAKDIFAPPVLRNIKTIFFE